MKKHDLEKFFKAAKSNSIEFVGLCHDCKDRVDVKADVAEDGKLTISGGAVYYSGEPRDLYLKCEKCYANNSELRDFQPCLVYSRVVGFYRPVGDWNAGKQEEFKARKLFDLKRFME